MLALHALRPLSWTVRSMRAATALQPLSLRHQVETWGEGCTASNHPRLAESADVDKEIEVIPDREHSAIPGLSIGGMQTSR